MWEELIDIIKALTKIYLKMLELNESKRKAILAIDMKILDELIDNEHQLINEVMENEQKRQNILQKMMQKKFLNNDDVITFKQLIKLCPTEKEENFVLANKALSDIVKKTTELNDANRMLMQGALTAVNVNLNSLMQMKSEPDYGHDGQQKFSSQRKNFDFKA